MKSVLILLSFALLTLGTGSRGLALEGNYDYWDQDQHRQAHVACYRGDLEVCHDLGWHHRVYNRWLKAREYFKKACDGGSAKGCWSAGGLAEDQCYLGEAENYYNRGSANKPRGYTTGKLAEKRSHLNDAIVRYKEDCNSGNRTACVALHDLEGKKGKWDDAIVRYERACNGGYPMACYHLGYVAHEEGYTCGGQKYYEKACNYGLTSGCNSLGTSYAEMQRYSDSGEYYKKACYGGDMRGCSLLGYTYYYRLGDKAEAKKYYTKACEAGYMGGCDSLGWWWYFHRYWGGGPWPEAKTFFKMACEGGLGGSCYSLGDLEEREGNISEAKKYYKKGCDLGDEKACKSVTKKSCNLGDEKACKSVTKD